MTEAVRAMSITGNDLLVAGKHVYNHYRYEYGRVRLHRGRIMPIMPVTIYG